VLCPSPPSRRCRCALNAPQKHARRGPQKRAPDVFGSAWVSHRQGLGAVQRLHVCPIDGNGRRGRDMGPRRCHFRPHPGRDGTGYSGTRVWRVGVLGRGAPTVWNLGNGAGIFTSPELHRTGHPPPCSAELDDTPLGSRRGGRTFGGLDRPRPPARPPGGLGG
jgi:hypothetical protein